MNNTILDKIYRWRCSVPEWLWRQYHSRSRQIYPTQSLECHRCVGSSGIFIF